MKREEDEARDAWEDPIVSEVRRVREALFASADCDLEKLSERLRREQADSGREVVTRSPKRLEREDDEAAC